ncbi:MAG: hypothetical protein Fur007_05580 [Rhodoferax sp.]
MSTEPRYQRLLSLARAACESQRWADALTAAGLAALLAPDDSAAFDLIAEVCAALGDHHAAGAFHTVTRTENPTAFCTAVAAEHPAPTESVLRNAQTPEPWAFSPLHIIAGGDVMLGRQMPGWVSLRGPDAPFEELTATLQSADLAMVNLEVNVSTVGDFIDKGGRQPYYYHCQPAMLEVLRRAGIRCVCVGNNHAADFGPTALRQQLDGLDRADWFYFGAGRTAQDAALPRFSTVQGSTVAWIGLETETPVMAATPSQAGVRYASPEQALRSLAASIALARARAQRVIVSPHWGVNWQDQPTEVTVALAHACIDLGADAVLGHSAHILQGIQWYRGCPIAYDMGTLLFDRVAQSTMRHSALFDLHWDVTGRCQLLLRPVRLRTARATWAQGEDFNHIVNTLERLSLKLDSSIQFIRTPQGLLSQAWPCPSPLRTLTHRHGGRVRKPQGDVAPRSNIASVNDWIYPHPPHTAGLWIHPLTVNPSLSILGARYASPVSPGRGFVCEVFFRAHGALPEQRIEARLAAFDAKGQEVFAYIHPVADGVCPPSQWHPDVVICDRVCVRPVQRVAPGRYTLGWTLIDLETGQLAPVVPDLPGVTQQHIILGEWVVHDDAPAGVAGISAGPRLPRLPQPEPTPDWCADPLQFWATHAQPWADAALTRAGVRRHDAPPEIVKASHDILVLRLRSDTEWYYFKAVAHNNRFEPALLHWLDGLNDPCVAPAWAVDTQRGFILSKDHGDALNTLQSGRNAENAVWLRLLPQLARLQIASTAHIPQLLAMGVPDARPDALLRGFTHLLHDPQAIHLGQPDGLSASELAQARALLPRLREVGLRLAQDAWSVALDHGDLHAGNVLINNQQVKVFDWDAAWISHPFGTLLLLLSRQPQPLAQAIDAVGPVLEAYLEVWHTHTGLAMPALRQRLADALWAAHALRALLWARTPDALETLGSAPQTLVCKWLRLWMKRQPEKAFEALPMVTLSDSKHRQNPRSENLASPDNPLLLTPDLIASTVGGTWSTTDFDDIFTGFSFKRDYMREGVTGNIFIAHQYDQRHTYSPSQLQSMAQLAAKNGAAALIVPQSLADVPTQLPVLRVPDDAWVLERLGRHVRDHLFAGKRVLVSGTEGKTGFKNLLHHVLTPQIPTHAMHCSANLDFGIWASLASIRAKDRIAILEAAETQPNRLARRSRIVQPHLFVLTEVGNEHLNFHGSQQAVIESCADIVTGLVEGGFGLLNADSQNYAATREAVLRRRRVPLSLFGTGTHCNGRLLTRSFDDKQWTVEADIEGHRLCYRLPLLGEHAPLESVSVLLAAYYLGANLDQAATAFETFAPYESQGVLRRLRHPSGELLCYDNATRASVLSYQSTLAMAARLKPLRAGGKKVAVIGEMIFLGDESERWHSELGRWVSDAGFDRIILVGGHTRATLAHLREPERVVQCFWDFDRRTASAQALDELIAAVLNHCSVGDLLFVKGEVDELGDYLRSLEIATGAPHAQSVAVKALASVTPPASSAAPASGDRARIAAAGMGDATQLADLQPLSIDHLSRYRAAIDETQRTTWQHYFPFMLFLSQSGAPQLLVGEDGESLCIYRLQKRGQGSVLSLFLLPMPASPEVIERCIARIQSHNGAREATIFRVDEADLVLFKGRPNTRIVRCPEEFIYAPADYLDLSGGKKMNLRQAVRTVQALPDVVVQDYQPEFASECLAVLDQWAALQKEKYGQVLYSGFTKACLTQYASFDRRDLFGKVVRVQGQIRSFGFAGEMRRGMGNLFINYSDHRITRLSKFMYHQLFVNMADLAFVNASHGGDSPGLTDAKQSLRPVSMFQPFQVYVQ